MVKKLLFSVYVFIIVVMAVATVIGNYTSLDYSIEHIFTSWWFCLLWAVGIIAGIIYFYKSRVVRLSLVMLHLSLCRYPGGSPDNTSDIVQRADLISEKECLRRNM